MSHILVKVRADYADEFYCKFFKVFTAHAWEEWKKDAAKNFQPNAEHYFGTNEFLSWSSFEEFMRNVTVIEISQDEYDTFCRCFDHGTFGTASDIFDHLLELPEEEEDSEDEE